MNTLTALTRSTRAELRRLWRWPATWVLVGRLDDRSTCCSPTPSRGSATAAGADPTVPAGTSPEALLAGLLPANVPGTLVQGMPMFGGAIVMILGALAIGSGYAWGTWKTVLDPGAGPAGRVRRHARRAGGDGRRDRGTDHRDRPRRGARSSPPSRAARPPLPAAGDLAAGDGRRACSCSAMWAAGGVLVGALAKGPALAAGLGLVWALVVENLLRGVSGLVDGMATLTDRLPGSAAGSLAGALGAAGENPRGGGTPGRAAPCWTAGPPPGCWPPTWWSSPSSR